MLLGNTGLTLSIPANRVESFIQPVESAAVEQKKELSLFCLCQYLYCHILSFL